MKNNTVELNRGTFLQDSEGNEFLLEKSVTAEIVGQKDLYYTVNVFGQNFNLEKYKVANASLIQETERFIKARVKLSEKDSTLLSSGEFLPDSKSRTEISQQILKAFDEVVDTIREDEDYLKKAYALYSFQIKKPLDDEDFKNLISIQEDIRKSLSGYALSLENNNLSENTSGLIFCNYLENGLNDVIQSREIIKAINTKKDKEYKIPDADAVFNKVKTDLYNFFQKAELSREVWLNIFKNKDNFNKGIEKRTVKEEPNADEAKVFKFKDYLDSSAGYKREDLPQVTTDKLDEFLDHFDNKKIKVTKKKMKLSSIKPAQSEINEDKLEKMIADGFDWKSRTFIISADNFLLDGHHTWAMGLEEDSDFSVSAWKISLPLKNLVSRANRMKVVEKRDIQDNKLSKAHETMLETLQRYDEDAVSLAKSMQSSLDSYPPELKATAKSILDFV